MLIRMKCMLEISRLSVCGDALLKCHILEQMIVDRHMKCVN